ncbi:MAG: hypothetical protein R3A46_12325 [Thermomicrobiales bacterium]
MNRLKHTLAGFGLALGLVALPLSAGADGLTGKHANHRSFTPEVIETMQYEPTAGYAMLDRTPLEEIAGRDNLDGKTIQFLEDNLWDHDIVAQPAGTIASNVGFYAEDPPLEDDWIDPYFNQKTGVDVIDLDMFSDEILWQDEFEDVAHFAILDQCENYYPSPDDVLQLRAGELNY